MTSNAGEVVTETLDYDGGRNVTAYLPSAAAEAVVLVIDGGWHAERLRDALAAEATKAGPPLVPTLIVGVHGLDHDEGRLAEYVDGVDALRFTRFHDFVINGVLEWIGSRLDIAIASPATAIWGASLGAEFALAMGLRHPEHFGAVLALSPGAGYAPPSEMPNPLPRTYLAAGTDEPFFLHNATRWAEALGDAHSDVVLRTRHGSHGDAFWYQEFPPMIRWAFDDLPR